jgi:hypothetical protein
MIAWAKAGEPKAWPLSNEIGVIVQIDRWLQEAGIHPVRPQEGKR